MFICLITVYIVGKYSRIADKHVFSDIVLINKFSFVALFPSYFVVYNKIKGFKLLAFVIADVLDFLGELDVKMIQ